MRIRSTATALALLVPAASVYAAIPFDDEHLDSHILRRSIITDAQVQPAYDFVIVGGGLAGLVIASRLTEDTNSTVLVLESGDTGDDVRPRIDIPSEAYFNGLLGTKYDWAYTTLPQPELGGRNISWPRGKGIGGSTAVNGMYLVRPSALEVDMWSALQGSAPGATAWSWEALFEAMKKSEKFTPPSAEIQAAGKILYDETSHGFNGPLHYSYPGYIVPIVGDWTATLSMIGVPPSPDANGGAGWGAFIATSSINPSNWTRSYSRTAYIDPLPPRPNLHILANRHVTKIMTTTDGGVVKATAVEFGADAAAARKTVAANREVLLAGGAVGSPQLLMHSGIGPKDALAAAAVPVVVDLPGVGHHVQDHISTEVVFKTSAQTAASIVNGSTGAASTVQSSINSAIAYVNVTDLVGDWAPTLHAQIMTNLTASSANPKMNPSTDATVKKGYEAIYKANADMLLSQIGQVELLFALTGTAVGGKESVAIQAALQHPFSMGRLWIKDNNPFNPPEIDPGYLTHFADVVLLREGLKLARKIGQSSPLNASMIQELSPGPTVVTDTDWDNWLRTKVGTEYHPSCTCAMLPRDFGGVVDANLLVYGTSNIRVVDSSVYPIQFAAHLMAPTYGLAEQAASIIRSKYNGTPSPAQIFTKTANPSTRTATGTTATSTPTRTSGASGAPSASNTSAARAGALIAGGNASIFVSAVTAVFGTFVGALLM